ncbi:MAG TPA: hypothetical protein VGE10_09925 [Zeimonas sp.]
MPIEFAVASPVTIRVARSDRDLARVFALRARSHAAIGSSPASDRYDRLPNSTLLLAEAAFDGEALGTLRILAGDRGPMMVDGLLELPASMKHRSIAEGSRLVVREGPHAQDVRRMLWKAFHRYCLAAQVQTMLVAAREAAARDYEWLGFTDVFPGGALFAPRGRELATHRLLQLGVFEAHEAMMRSGHPLREFFFLERHPEIDLLGGAVGAASRAAAPPTIPDHLRMAAQLAEVAIV